MNPNPADHDLAVILAEHGFEARVIEVRVGGTQEQPMESVKVRVPVAGGREGGSKILGLLNLPWHKRGNPLLHLHAIRLLKLRPVAEDARRRNARTLGSKGIFHTPSLREVGKKLTTKWSLPAVVRAFAPAAEGDQEELVETALYTNTLASIDEPRYRDFSDMVLDDLDRWDADLKSGKAGARIRSGVLEQPHIKKILAEIEAREAADNGEDRYHSAIQLPRSEDDVVGWSVFVDAAWDGIVRYVLRTARQKDSERGDVFAAVAKRAASLLDEARALGSRSKSSLAWKGLKTSIDECLRETLVVLDSPGMKDKTWSEQSKRTIRQGLASRQTAAKLFLLRDIAEIGDRSQLLELLLREADIAPYYILGRAARELYRRIRRFLTPVERRLFMLLYLPDWPRIGESLPSLPFAGWPLWALPFFQAMLRDGDLVGLAVLCVGHKRRSIGHQDLASELSAIFRKYVTFYAMWASLVREDDKLRKRARRRPKETELNQDIASLTVRDARKELSAFLESVLAKSKGPARRSAFARKYFVEGATEVAIADEAGVSQQFVAKEIRRFVKCDLEPLSRWQGASPYQVLQAAGYLRRGRRPRSKR